jgi:hypothetical protein
MFADIHSHETGKIEYGRKSTVKYAIIMLQIQIERIRWK